jgi:hypothetical protein
MTSSRVEPISVEANSANAPVRQVKRSGRSQNRMHTQKALLEYLLLGKVEQ